MTRIGKDTRVEIGCEAGVKIGSNSGEKIFSVTSVEFGVDTGVEIGIDLGFGSGSDTQWAIWPLHWEKSLPGPLDAQNPPQPVKVMKVDSGHRPARLQLSISLIKAW